jgi:hypothetical protein
MIRRVTSPGRLERSDFCPESEAATRPSPFDRSPRAIQSSPRRLFDDATSCPFVGPRRSEPFSLPSPLLRADLALRHPTRGTTRVKNFPLGSIKLREGVLSDSGAFRITERALPAPVNPFVCLERDRLSSRSFVSANPMSRVGLRRLPVPNRPLPRKPPHVQRPRPRNVVLQGA